MHSTIAEGVNTTRKDSKAMCKEATSMVLAVCCAVVLAEPPRVKRRKPLTANVGVVSVGLDTYWKQCPGLYDDMLFSDLKLRLLGRLWPLALSTN